VCARRCCRNENGTALQVQSIVTVVVGSLQLLMLMLLLLPLICFPLYLSAVGWLVLLLLLRDAQLWGMQFGC
jgi:hypothetical protein